MTRFRVLIDENEPCRVIVRPPGEKQLCALVEGVASDHRPSGQFADAARQIEAGLEKPIELDIESFRSGHEQHETRGAISGKLQKCPVTAFGIHELQAAGALAVMGNDRHDILETLGPVSPLMCLTTCGSLKTCCC